MEETLNLVFDEISFEMGFNGEKHASGPQDSSYLFKKFTKIMEERKNA